MNKIKIRNKSKSNIDFKLMSFFFKIRDIFEDPMKKIEKIGIKEGDFILDYGCGSGSFTIPAAKLAGSTGKVYAADIHPLSSEKVKKKAEKNQLKNIKTIQTECETNLSDNAIDVILLIDVLHNLENYSENLKEFHRILKAEGTFWVDDHHYEDSQIKFKITENNLFKFSEKIDSLYKFTKII
jgi:ubiquinone/menaquinone biosynthesis C-methylase UbiE